MGLETDLVKAWRPKIDALFARLDAAREASPLPEEPANERDVAAWLLDVRVRGLQG